MFSNSNSLSLAALVAATALSGVHPASAQTEPRSIPSVIITVSNVQDTQGVFLSAPWVGLHAGTFDLFDVGSAVSVPLGGNDMEQLAEDGSAEALAMTFASLTGRAPQLLLEGPEASPLGPGERVSATLNVDPMTDRYLSFASMVLPSNDTFIANDDPVAHPLFDEQGVFIGKGFVVSGMETRDAGTELNDEVATNVAFLFQNAPDTGVVENGVVVSPSPSLDVIGANAYPDGILNYPVFLNADCSNTPSGLLLVELRSVDLAGKVSFRSALTKTQGNQDVFVDSPGFGKAQIISRNSEQLRIRIGTKKLTGPATSAHLHLGKAGSDGPAVLDLGSGIHGSGVHLVVDADDLIGPMAGQELLALVNELAAGNVYVNVHTEAYPDGEIRGQFALHTKGK